MEQYASDRFYLEQSEGLWHVAEHITEPRPSCIGLPRQYAPPVIEEDPFVPVNKRHPLYAHIYRTSAGWQGKYYVERAVHYTPTCRTGREAAEAYNAVVIAAGMPERYWIVFDDEGLETAS